MNPTEAKLKQLNNPELTPDQRTLLRCRVAAELIRAGHYEMAREALSDLWKGVGQRPETEGLPILITAEVLMQCGVLSGWLGSVRPVPDAQERAKDLIFEAFCAFQSLEQPTKASEAQYELGLCYFRLGSYGEARVILDEAFSRLGEAGAELKALISIRRASVEIWVGRYYEARRVLDETRPVFEGTNDVLRGKWHGQMGLVFRRLAGVEGKADYYDHAIMEYTAAIHYYEQARHERYYAGNLNNLAFLFYKLGRYEQAHENLSRAARVFKRLKDEGLLAQVNETRARVFVAEEKYREANRSIADVIETLEKGEEYAMLADALSLQGVVWARLGIHDSSLKAFRRAVTVARDAGAFSHAALALLALIEEHGAARLSEYELCKTYHRADYLLRGTQDAEEMARLRECARIVTTRFTGPELGDKGFTLPQAVHAYEARFISQALEMEDGSVARAAKRLGVKHQTLVHLLKKRHKPLASKRTPPVPRRKSIIKKK